MTAVRIQDLAERVFWTAVSAALVTGTPFDNLD